MSAFIHTDDADRFLGTLRLPALRRRGDWRCLDWRDVAPVDYYQTGRLSLILARWSDNAEDVRYFEESELEGALRDPVVSWDSFHDPLFLGALLFYNKQRRSIE